MIEEIMVLLQLWTTGGHRSRFVLPADGVYSDELLRTSAWSGQRPVHIRICNWFHHFAPAVAIPA